MVSRAFDTLLKSSDKLCANCSTHWSRYISKLTSTTNNIVVPRYLNLLTSFVAYFDVKCRHHKNPPNNTKISLAFYTSIAHVVVVGGVSKPGLSTGVLAVARQRVGATLVPCGWVGI